MTTPIVTLHMLRHYGACAGIEEAFSEEFPSGSVELTPENLQKYDDAINPAWIMEKIFKVNGKLTKNFYETARFVANLQKDDVPFPAIRARLNKLVFEILSRPENENIWKPYVDDPKGGTSFIERMSQSSFPHMRELEIMSILRLLSR